MKLCTLFLSVLTLAIYWSQYDPDRHVERAIEVKNSIIVGGLKSDFRRVLGVLRVSKRVSGMFHRSFKDFRGFSE